MQIACNRYSSKVATRQQAENLLRKHLESLQAPEPNIPVVRIMVGDHNLTPQQLSQAVQVGTKDAPIWDVCHTPTDSGGDNVAVTGADAVFKSIPAEHFCANRGMHNDCHDAVGITITVRSAPQPAKRRPMEPMRASGPPLVVRLPATAACATIPTMHSGS